ncbi:unnamed protein product [Cuscuta epithymum]|nr:unnamed protein product [Cuscuta epithymum]
MTMWSIWRKRNVLYWDGIQETITQVISRGAEVLHSWEAGQGSKGNKRVGFGCCVRDHMGRFSRARTSWMRAEMSPAEAEAWSLREALKWMQETEYTRVIFESDCKQLVDDIYNAHKDRSEYGSLVHDCRNIVGSNNDFCVVFARRQANSSAHALARASTSYASCTIFLSVPYCIENIVIDEMN